MKPKSSVVLVCAAAAVVAVVWLRRSSDREQAQPEPEEQRVEQPAAAPPTPAPVAEKPADRAPSPAKPAPIQNEGPKPLSEPDLMARMRELADGQHAAEVLKLAQEGNRRFPGSPDTPERDARAVRALVDLQRQPEAEVLARQLILQYPGTSWASDVGRHMFASKELWDKAMGGSAP